jgi:DNA invertase Pin-like site-specific DNA recombinase
MARGKFIAYYRVSTERQGKSGLGLDAQRTAVLDYLNGGGWKLLGEFTEVETGKGRNALARRPQLRAALEACRKHKATLLIAKLDRLARNVFFVSGLMESGVEFVAVDMPMANRLTVHILAAVAEHEREMISQRTKAALAAAKARGVISRGMARQFWLLETTSRP